MSAAGDGSAAPSRSWREAARYSAKVGPSSCGSFGERADGAVARILDADELTREGQLAGLDPGPDVLAGDRQLGGTKGGGLGDNIVRVELLPCSRGRDPGPAVRG